MDYRPTPHHHIFLAVNQHHVSGWQRVAFFGRPKRFLRAVRNHIGHDGFAFVSEAYAITGRRGVVHHNWGTRGNQDCAIVFGDGGVGWDHAWLTLTTDSPLYIKDNGRTALRSSKGNVAVYSLHGPLIGSRWEEAMKRLAIHVRADISAGKRVIVGGDLNTDMRSVGSARLVSWAKGVGLVHMESAPTSMWILASRNVGLSHRKDYAVGSFPGSDHEALSVVASW